MSVLYETLIFENIEYGQSSSTGQMIATERSAQLSIDGFEVRSDQHATHRKAIGNTLCHCDDIRTDAQPLMGEELSATAIAALYLVANQHGAVFLAGSSQSLCKFGRGHLDAAHALDTLQDDSAYIALSQFSLPCWKIIHWQISDVAIIIDRGNNLRIVGHLYGQTCPAMESLLC